MSLPLDALWKRLPLAEAFLLLLRQVWPPEALDQFYDLHRGRHFQREITFSGLVDLLLQALVHHQGRLHPVLKDRDDLPASVQAIYAKGRRLPRDVSHALVAADANRQRELLPAGLAAPPTGVRGVRKFRHLVIDGHVFKRASKRLKTVRGTPGRALGGKMLAVLEVQSDLVVGLHSDAHAHINEQALLPGVLEQVRSTLPGPRLWIADRAYGNLANFKRCTAGGDHALLRKTVQSVFHPDPASEAVVGLDDRQRPVRDELGTLSSKREGRQAARQITVERPGQTPLVLLCSLLDRDEYPAADLLELYRQRWSIERKFQKVSEMFTMGPYFSSTPDGILFHSALGLVLANTLTLLQTLMAREAERETETVSTHTLHRVLKDELGVCRMLMTVDELVESLQDRVPVRTVAELLDQVRSRLRQAWHPKFEKSPPKKRPGTKVKHRRGQGGHFSIERVLTGKSGTRSRKKKPHKPPKQDV